LPRRDRCASSSRVIGATIVSLKIASLPRATCCGRDLAAGREQRICVTSETIANRHVIAAAAPRCNITWSVAGWQSLVAAARCNRCGGAGQGAYLSRETVTWLKLWLDHVKISEGTIFRRLIGRDEIRDALHPDSIAPIFKRVAQWIGMPARFVAEVSGHSTSRNAKSFRSLCSNWGQFATCYRNFRSQRKEYGK
jgi:hypothetical protein